MLTEVGFYLNEITTRLRVYDSDTATLTSIADSIKQVKATARSQGILFSPSVLPDSEGYRPSNSRYGLPFNFTA